MSLSGKICWDHREVPDLINPYAEHMSDSIFRFVHSDWELSLSSPKGVNFQSLTVNDFKPITQSEFLSDFLDSKRPHVLAAILGTTGTGKSHLVHWMKFNLPPSENRLVIVVKKSGTSLKQIVKSVIDELPEETGKTFLDTFNAAGDNSMSESNQRHRILNDLAEAIRETHERHSQEQSTDLDEEISALIETLPDLLQDPHMRTEHFTKDGSVIADIANHIFATSTSEHRPEARRQFSETDLPDGGRDFDAASAPARDALSILLMADEYKSKAVNVLNEHLDSAIARSLNLSGDVIEQLMVELRKYLKKQGKELILLVEEFARLQGIDRILLQTITTQGGEEQCKMRTAIAVTDGFFESVAETAYMRTTHIVNMDIVSSSNNTKDGVSSQTLSKFVSGYLNAVRVGRGGIKEWHDNHDFTEKPISKCDSCDQREHCHVTFGEVDGVGLYPFTDRAIWNLSQRIDENFPDTMNPRVIQQQLLKPTLDEFHKEISETNFPSEEFLAKFGGPISLPVLERSKLQSLDKQKFARWVPFLEIYDGNGKVLNLSKDLMTTLNIENIPDVGEVTHEVDTGEEDSKERRPRADVTPSDPNQRLLEEWVQGDPLNENVTNKLRNLLYSTLVENIRWDNLNLVKTHFAAQSGSQAFKRTSISFEGQTTQQHSAKIQLVIARNEDSATALQGLLKFNKNNFTWDFKDGLTYFFHFNQALMQWRESIEKQLLELRGKGKKWDSVDASFELLALQSAMSGLLKINSTTSDLIDAAFKDSPSQGKFLSQRLNDIYLKITTHKSNLESEFLSFTVSSKGGVTGNMINPSRFMDSAKKFTRGTWEMRQSEPDEVSKIGKLYSQVKASLHEAIKEERDLRVNWLNTITENLGQNDKETILKNTESFIASIKESGIGIGIQRKSLTEKLEDFRSRHFDDAVGLAQQINTEVVGLDTLLKFSGTRSAAVNATNQLISSLTATSEAVETALNSQTQLQGRDVDQIVSLRSEISNNFNELDQLIQSGDLLIND